jgi:hypothetical protein
MNNIDLTNQERNHIGNALMFMCRYSYNRKTSADMACNSALKALWKYVPESHRIKIIDEIKSEADLDSYGSLWRDFLEWESKVNAVEKFSMMVHKGVDDERD